VSGGGIVGTGSTPYLTYWKGLTAIGSTNQPGSLGFYFDSREKYAINANTVSTAALSIFNHSSGSYITPPTLVSAGTTLLTQVNGNTNNQYDIAGGSGGFIHYYSGGSVTPNINLFSSVIGGGGEYFEFAPANFGDITSTNAPKVNISKFGVKIGSYTTGAIATSDLHLGHTSHKTGTLGFDGITSGKVTVTVNDVAGTWIMKLPTSAGSSGQFLQTDGAGITTWATPAGGGGAGVTGSGTNNYFPRWTGFSTLS
jgi:hypothetical protein